MIRNGCAPFQRAACRNPLKPQFTQQTATAARVDNAQGLAYINHARGELRLPTNVDAISQTVVALQCPGCGRFGFPGTDELQTTICAQT